MVTQTIKTIIQIRRAHTDEWISNKDIVPAAGEPCFDLDLKTLKIGDGTTTYENLPVVGNSEISSVYVGDTLIEVAEKSVKIPVGAGLQGSNEVTIGADNTLGIGTISMSKLVQDDETVLILDGGSSI